MIFGPLSLWLMMSAVTGITIAACVVAVRQPDRGGWSLAGAAFAIVLGASLLWIDLWAQSHPVWDQLTEGPDLYQPFAAGSYTWSRLFEKWNEHRIVLTRLWSLSLFSIDHHWNNRTQAIANALLHALPAGLLMLMLRRALEPFERLLVAIVIVLPFALPLAIQNVTWGFQSQFYFLLLFAPLALWLLVQERSVPRVCLGAACLALTLLSVGSGLLCALALLLTLTLESLRVRGSLREKWPVLLIAVAMLVLGRLLLGTRPYPGTSWVIVQSTLHAAAFPFTEHAWMAALMWSPALIWFFWLMRQRRQWTPLERFTLALAATSLLHAAAIGLTRGWFSIVPSTRYHDLLALGPLANMLAALALLRLRSTRWPEIALASWMLLTVSGTLLCYRHVLIFVLPGWRQSIGDQMADEMRAYLQTGDPTKLKYLEHEIFMPRFDRAGMAHLLDDPFIQSILPATLRPSNRGRLSAHIHHPRTAAYLLLGSGAAFLIAATVTAARSRPHD